MAMDFGDDTGYFGSDGLVTAYPFTIACWFKMATHSAVETICGLSLTSSATSWQLLQRHSTDKVAAASRAGGGARRAISGNAFTGGTWQHVAGTFVGAADRNVHLNGAFETQDTASANAASYDRFNICTFQSAAGGDGEVAEVGVWGVVLDTAEIAALGKGVSPSMIRPAALLDYRKLIRGPDDPLGMGALTVVGAPVVSVHPPIIYPYSPGLIVPTAGAPPAGNAMPMAIHHYRRRRAG